MNSDPNENSPESEQNFSPAQIAERVRAALSARITPQLIAERIAQLPPEAQARLRAEFAERPTVYKTKIVIRKPRKK